MIVNEPSEDMIGDIGGVIDMLDKAKKLTAPRACDMFCKDVADSQFFGVENKPE